MLTEKQIVDSINENLQNMAEGVPYYFNAGAFANYNESRKKHGYGLLKREDYVFIRTGGNLVVNGKVVCPQVVDSAFVFAFFAFAFAFAFSFAFAPMERVTAYQAPDTCDNKVVEIDGKKYRLTLT